MKQPIFITAHDRCIELDHDPMGPCAECVQAVHEEAMRRSTMAAAYAYLAIYREGWEEGINASEAGSELMWVLSDLGLNTADEMISWLTTEKRLAAEGE